MNGFRVLLAACVMACVVASPRPLRGQQIVELFNHADAADSAGHFAEAVLFWRRAFAISGGDPIPLYFAARSAARAAERDTAFALLGRALGDGIVLPFAIASDTLLAALHGDPRWPSLVTRERDMTAGRDTALRAELMRLAVADQANRATIGATISRYGNHTRESDSAFAAMSAGDAPLQARLRAIVQAYGWPGRQLVGDDGAHQAWLLLQHADSSYQRAMLPVLLAAVERGDVRAADAAYLEDRVRVGEGLPQRYGTQFGYPATPGGTPVLSPIEDERCVDRRRAAVQLPPLAEYVHTFGAEYTPPSERCP